MSTGAEAGEQRFPYHRAVAPMMWVIVAICAVELFVVHFLISFWSPLAAGILSAATLVSIIWLIVMIRSFTRLPVLLDDMRLLMRVGRMRELSVPVAAIAGLRSSWTAETLKAPDLLNLAMIAYPNVVVDFATPLSDGRRSLMAVAHRLDNPEAFAAAVTDMLSRRATSS